MTYDSRFVHETYARVNDYTLAVGWRSSEFFTQNTRLMRIFNFSAQEVTILTEYPSPTKPVFTSETRKFSDLENLGEVQILRRTLIDLGGHPPEIDDADSRKLSKKPYDAANGTGIN